MTFLDNNRKREMSKGRDKRRRNAKRTARMRVLATRFNAWQFPSRPNTQPLGETTEGWVVR